MFGKIRAWRWLLTVLLLGLADGAGLTGIAVGISTPAQAQFWGGDYPGSSYGRRQRPPRSNGFFGGWFGGGGGGDQYYERRLPREPLRHEAPPQQVDNSHAPPPRKEAKSDVAPSTTIVVMGDGMADWLAYGLEDAFSDNPEIAVVRKDKPNSGLLRYDVKGDLDWWHVARDLLAQEKPSYIVMMLGVTDRQNIRERDLAKEVEKEAKEQEAKDRAAKEQAAKDQPAKEPTEKKTADTGADPDQQDKPAAEQKPDAGEENKPKRRPVAGSLEFRSEQWEKVYSRRIDETIAALKSKGVPVFWVGLPAIKGAKSTADTSYLNNLYRTRAQRAGIVYIDVWDGFVDESGRYTSFGPDYEGQERRLRSNDGVYFTKYGARKLAHYVEREIRRYMANRVVSVPAQPAGPAPAAPGKPAERPLAGPVVPLALAPASSDELLGGGAGARVHGDPLATQVLVKGEPVRPQAGRSDDFAWPPGSAPRPVAAEPPKQNEKPGSVAAASAQPAQEPKPAQAPVAVPPAESPVAAQPPNSSAAPEDTASRDALANPAPEDEADRSEPAAEPKAQERPKPAAKPKRAEIKPKPRHYEPPARPPHAAQSQRPSDPFREMFGVFR